MAQKETSITHQPYKKVLLLKGRVDFLFSNVLQNPIREVKNFSRKEAALALFDSVDEWTQLGAETGGKNLGSAADLSSYKKLWKGNHTAM